MPVVFRLIRVHPFIRPAEHIRDRILPAAAHGISYGNRISPLFDQVLQAVHGIAHHRFILADIQQHKFIPADPVRHDSPAGNFLHTFADGLQRFVSRLVAFGIVQLLQPVHIHRGHRRNQRSVPLGFLIKRKTVPQPRQRIPVRIIEPDEHIQEYAADHDRCVDVVRIHFPVQQCRHQAGNRADIKHIPVPRPDLIPEPRPGSQHSKNNIEEADAEHSQAQRSPDKPVLLRNLKGNRREEGRAVYQCVQDKRNPQIERPFFLRINNLGNAHRRCRTHYIANHREYKSKNISVLFLLGPDVQGIRRDQDNGTEDRQPEIAQVGIPCAPLAAKLHGKTNDQEDRDEVPVQYIRHSPA